MSKAAHYLVVNMSAHTETVDVVFNSVIHMIRTRYAGKKCTIFDRNNRGIYSTVQTSRLPVK